MSRLAIGALVVATCGGCGPGDKGPGGSNPDRPDLIATVRVSAEVPTVLHVTWSTEESGTSWVEYGLSGRDLQTPTSIGTKHAIAVLGLKAARTYSLRAVTEVDGVRFESEVKTVEIAAAPAWYGEFSVDQYDPQRAEMAAGFVLVGASVAIGGEFADVGSFVAIIDVDGDYVWFRDLPPGVGTLSPSVVSGGILWDEYDSYVSDDFATASVVDITGNGPVIATPIADGHHAVIETEPGKLAFIARDIRTIQIDEQDVVIQTDRIREIDIGSDTPAEVFALFDSLQDSFHWPCSHTFEPHSRTSIPLLYEWTHGNSLVYDGGALFLYTRWTDTLYKVDAATGALIWQLGGPDSDFTLPGGDPVWTAATESALWSHGHLSHLWDGGFVLFDNGSHSTPKISGIAEFVYSEADDTVAEVFRFSDPLGRFTGVVGDARKLPGGNYLASWTTFGELTEISADGDIVWRATNTAGHATARVRYIGDLYALDP